MALIVFVFSAGTACGVSPALHHENADQPKIDQSSSDEDSTGRSGGAGSAPVCDVRLPSENLCVDIVPVKPFEVYEESPYLLKVCKEGVAVGAEGPFVDPVEGNLYSDIWMQSMGHGGGKKNVIITKEDTGIYRATDVIFTMPGKWWIRVNLKRKSDASFVEPTGASFPHQEVRL